jgi:hypothetical protein
MMLLMSGALKKVPFAHPAEAALLGNVNNGKSGEIGRAHV